MFFLDLSVQAQQTEAWVNCTGNASADTSAFQSAITSAGGNPRTIRIPRKSDLATRCTLNTLTIPSYVAIDNSDGSGIFVVSGQTLTVAGARVNPAGKTMFFGPGVLTLTGATYLNSTDVLTVSDGSVTPAKFNTTAIDPASNVAGARTLGTGSQQAAPGNDSRITGAAQKASNLSDLPSASSARSNLGLGTVVVQNVGTGPGNIPQLDSSGRLPPVDGSLLTNIGGAGGSLSFTFGSTDLWDNVYWTAQSGFNQHSSMARALFTTSATSVSINVFQNGLGGPAVAIQVWVNGVVYASPNVPSSGAQTLTQSLPAGYKLIAIVAGTQGIASPPGGAYLVSCTFNALATELAPRQLDRLTVYGDSISQGGGGNPNIATAWPTYYRAMTDRSVVLEAYSGRSLFNDCDTAPHCATFIANKITPGHPTTMWIEMGTNDYQGGSWNAADFGTAYVNLLDTLHSQMPGLIIYCQTPIVMTLAPSETPNGFGNIMEDYRAQIRTAVWARTDFTRLIEGPDIVTQADLIDGIHPNDTGNKKFAFYVYRTLLGWKERDGNPADVPDLATTENVIWSNAVNVSVSTNNLTKNAGGSAYNAGATSTRCMLFNSQSDSWTRWTITETNTSRVVGLEKTHIGANFTEILFSHGTATAGSLGFFESGTGLFSGVTPVQAGDIEQIRIRPPKLYYERIRNGITTLIRVSPQIIVPSMFPLCVDVSMLEQTSTVTNMQIHGILQ